jgi:hypothetical protein
MQKEQTSPLSFPCNQINLVGWDACLSYWSPCLLFACFDWWMAGSFPCMQIWDEGWMGIWEATLVDGGRIEKFTRMNRIELAMDKP